MDSPWISAIVIVNFEIEKGQEVELVHPENLNISDDERKNLAYMSLPDSNSGTGETTSLYHFNLRTKKKLPNQLISFNRVCKQELKADEGHFWGYVYFRQKKDISLKRGYFQKSFVLLSRLPFHNFFYELISRWAPIFFSNGLSSLQSGFNSVLTQWPNLSVNTSFQLPILGVNYQIFIPAANINRTQQNEALEEDSTNNNRDDGSSIPISLTSVSEIDNFGAIHAIIHHIQLIWELVLIGEPILVIATSPTDSSIIVTSLTNLIAPLEYFPEVFPYFTIHNSEFREFANTTKSVILGCTNPYFAKTLSMMNTIKINEPLQNNSDHPLPHRKMEKVKSVQKLLMDTSNSILYTQHKPFLQKDKQFVKKILNGVKTRRPSGVQSIILRRYFLELTQSFMIPLERYMNTLMPLFKDISAFRAPPVPAQFNETTFLGTLDLSGPQLTSTIKGDYEGLYRKFFASSNFRGWYENRRLEQIKALEELHQEAIAKVDFNQWIRGKQEVEIVDMILCIKNKLQLPANSNSTLNLNETGTLVMMKQQMREMLMRKLNELISSLPDDLKAILT